MQAQIQSLDIPLKLFQQHINYQQLDYDTMDADNFEKALEQYRKDDEILSSIKQQEPMAQKSIQKMQSALPNITFERAQKFSDEVLNHYRKISFNPQNLQEFVQFLDNFKQIEDAMDNLLLNSSSIQSLLFLCQQQRIMISEYQKTEISKCQNQMSNLKKRIDEIMVNQENNMEKFRRELEKIIPQMELKAKEVEEKLQQSAVGRKNSDVNQIVKILQELSGEIQSIAKEKQDIKIFEETLQVGDISDLDKLDSLINRFQLMENEVAVDFKREVERFQYMHKSLISLQDQHLSPKQWQQIGKIVLQNKTEKELLDLNIKDTSSLFKKFDEILENQKNWIYLEPILSTHYAQKNLINESKLFLQCDFFWKKLTKAIKENPMGKKWVEDYKGQQNLQQIKQSNHQFELVKRSLDDFLEKKKESFKRFFFLSNEELLMILSQVQNLSQIQPHLRKVFENVASLDIDVKENVNSVISSEGEVLPLKNCFPKGEIEDWLIILEDCIQTQLRQLSQRAYNRYDQEETEHTKWVLEYPSQIVQVIDAIWWTKITEELLSANNLQELFQWYEAICIQIDDIIELLNDNLKILQRKTLVALITQEVHYRDIVSQLIINKSESVQDFLWQKQIRFYNPKGEDIKAEQINTQLEYGYEYIGASSRLVITPLTDRCWITMTSALHIKLGASPLGPAGTGKSESIKDLAKQLGRFCVVFNCSNQITAKIMGKLFMGLCYTGSWTCLDEFNRINIEVLSVIAQQILTIRQANLRDSQNMFFSGKYITFNNNIGIFITLNPNYIGRTELPDNLKTLFRPVAMMIPEYSLICEIMLFAEGFGQASDLSKKISKLYKLCTEQLSQQEHYDFGMRAVKQVLVLAGSMKRQKGRQFSESQILIKAFRSTNLPKFLKHDIPLFNAILSDLFPGEQFPDIKNQELSDSIEEQIELQKFKNSSNFVERCLQLHEGLQVRHGFMLVGPSMSGKSTIRQIVKDSLNALKMKNSSNMGVISQTINPKAISIDELYGIQDPITNVFNDGLASQIFRNFSLQTDPTMEQWIIFDGPVDSIWAENMNTVLDESTTLCLSNGERIKLQENLKVLFEVLNLNNASLSTVSRCGIIYIDNNIISYENILERKINKALEKIKNQDVQFFLQETVLQVTSKYVQFILEHTNPTVPIHGAVIIQQLCQFLKVVIENDENILEMESNDQYGYWKKSLEKLLIYCYYWAISTTLPNNQIPFLEKFLFDAFIQEPVKGQLHNFYLCINDMGSEFVKWGLLLDTFKYNPDQRYQEIFISTQETVCYSWFLKKFLVLNQPILLTVKNTIREIKKEKSHLSIQLSFSPQTNSNDTQQEIELNLESNRKKGKQFLAPPPGQTLLIFIDDLNLPQSDAFGSQQVLELLRFFLEHQGFYDKSTKQFKKVENTCCCGTIVQNQKQVSPKTLRHFTQMAISSISDDSLLLIFSSIVKGFLNTNNFKQEIKEFGEKGKIVQSTLQIYENIQLKLLPVPSKPHYTFSLRDVSNVFRGILRATQNTIQDIEQFTRLWTFEIICTFYDRLISKEDRDWFQIMILDILSQNFRMDFMLENIFGSDGQQLVGIKQKYPIMFANFLNQSKENQNDKQKEKEKGQEKLNENQVQNQNEKEYLEIENFPLLIEVINKTVQETGIKMSLFLQIIEIIVKTCRVISQDKGHQLLVGINGCGKKSISKIASKLLKQKFITVIETQSQKVFREQILEVMKYAGLEQKHITYYVEDNGNIDTNFFEDINSLLHTGEIPNTLNKEELQIIQNTLQDENIDILQNQQKNSVREKFSKNVLQYLHIILGFSPIGPDLRQNLRKYRNFVNQTTIKWIQPWPEEALLSISKSFFDENLMFEGIDQKIKMQICNFSVEIHKSAIEKSKEYERMWKRKIYITPRNYIQFLKTYISLLDIKQKEIGELKDKLSKGVNKIQHAKTMIIELQEKMTNLQPLLIQKTAETEQLIKKLRVDKDQASIQQKIVEEEERIVNDKKLFIEEKAEEAQKILAEAKPQLKIAQESLNTLNRNDISEIKSIPSPHPLVKFTMECVAILLEEGTSWDSIKRFISDSHFLQRLKQMNSVKSISSVKPQTLQTLKDKIAKNSEFKPKSIKNISLASKSICEWVLAVMNVVEVYNQIQEKKENVNDLKKELLKTQEQLQKKREEMEFQVQKVKTLENEFQDSQQQKQQLNEDIQKTQKRLTQASSLLDGLADEQVRWQEQVESIEKKIQLLPGDMFISAGCVNYHGPYPKNYRAELEEHWIQYASKTSIPMHKQFSLSELINPKTLRNWQQNGLPQDDLSIQNAIIQNHSILYPFLIDPQLQAQIWLKKLHGKNIYQTKMDDENLQQKLEMCILNDKALIIEQITEKINFYLYPLLQKKFSMRGNQKIIKLGNKKFEVTDNFKLYIISKQNNPKLSPYLFSLANIINFSVTLEGLQEQFLGDVVSTQMPEVEMEKKDIQSQILQGQDTLRQNEEKILELLNASDTDLLDDNELINSLENSKITSIEVKRGIQEGQLKQKQIDTARQICDPIARRASLIFFVINDLSEWDFFLKGSFALTGQSKAKNKKQGSTCSIGLIKSERKIDSDKKVLKQKRPLNLQKQNKGYTFDQKYQNELKLLSLVHKNFEQIFQNMQENHTEWEQWYKSPDITQVNLPLGSDPLLQIQRFANSILPEEIAKKMIVLSLGQGQEEIALRSIQQGVQEGVWVVLQNLHLGESFLPKLDQEIESLQANLGIHQNFRLFLTTMSCDYIPVSILQYSLKLSDEAPKSIKPNLIKIFESLKPSDFEQIEQKVDKEKFQFYKKMIFTIILFHTTLQERKKYGPLGWNIQYEFNESDLEASHQVLKDILIKNNKLKQQNNEDIQFNWTSFQYILGEINYGGRITNNQDLSILQAYIHKFCNVNVVQDDYKFTEHGAYKQLNANSEYEDYRQAMQNYPEQDQFEIFGLYPNAQIYIEVSETHYFFETLIESQPKVGQFSKTEKQKQEEVDEIIQYFIDNFPSEIVKQDYSKDQKDRRGNKKFAKQVIQNQQQYSSPQKQIQQTQFQKKQQENNNDGGFSQDPIKTCLLNECQKFNILRNVMFQSLRNLQKAIRGAFHYPQGFLTSVLQQYSRQNKVSLDQLTFKYSFKNVNDKDYTEKRLDHGYYLSGLFIEGCKLNTSGDFLEEQTGNTMYQPAPIIQIIPKPLSKQDQQQIQQNIQTNPANLVDMSNQSNLKKSNGFFTFKMPVYRNIYRSSNQLSLASSGHDNNFIINIDVKSKEPVHHWVLKGAAFLCEIN
ncbi:P-loop containing nucleoside triphosphate hydrolase [Pseudocohnilembus persalinus]|uniref:p-loop containing nucleoside triphosphate hydrolase n=1 Tax=Pseudocohnilembus persalinus TaxID=266149 RepID=A0A0V0QHI1_PSEPJ|nr:P-loop containing nucleoside triphosphate hydrolase [Pseudocohnilembus persalinus]|eukprot:KRX01504.1 P-loop containing nucleoside triphosphate hydrolase [Pseudocohnilembus persalinus]